MVQYLTRQNKPNLAYIFDKRNADLPAIVFLGGFRSDMMGTKAAFLSDLCVQQNRSFLRFDYSGHGQSEGEFADLTIGDWLQDTHDMMRHHNLDNVILIGSSMGGWLSLLTLKHHPQWVHGFVGIAAAPDFTTWIEEAMTPDQRQEMQANGHILIPNDYDEPYMITKNLLDDGRKNLLLNDTVSYNGAVHLLQGKQDADVPWQTAEKIKNILPDSQVSITYVQDGNHSLSSSDDLVLLRKAIEKMM